MNEPIFEIKEEEKKENYSKFVISPLERGYGITLGNSLRRVLLTSLPGAAIVSVKISGVKHQFSTLKGMKQDVIEFLLNLKKVRILYEGQESAKAEISVTGPREVTARDIKTDSSIKIANPDLPLAYLNKGSKLDAKLEVRSGVGYSLSDESEANEIGLIPLDAAFSPVVRVNYRVEETRVGRLTNYDKLILEVWTDGTLEPEKALLNASQILVSYYNQIISPRRVEKKEDKIVDDLGPSGKLSVEEIGLPTRVANALIKAGFETVEDLVKSERDGLVKVRNLGEKSVKIIDAALGDKGLKLGSK